MLPKSERFEMRLDEDTLARVDRWRGEQPELPSRAEAMRRLVEGGLAKSSGSTATFTDGEKLLILMMRDLSKHLKLTDGDTDPEFLSKVIYGGHYWAPVWQLPGVFHGHADDPRDLRLTLDVLDMWDCIERGYGKLSKKDRDRIEKEAAPFGKHVRFLGFDGNNEAPLLGIALFLVNDMERFSRFKGRDLNAHMPTIAANTRMLDVFAAMRRKIPDADLGPTQIIGLLLARRPPE